MESRKAFIEVKGKELELFKTALELARDKYIEWRRIAKENNVTDMSKLFSKDSLQGNKIKINLNNNIEDKLKPSSSINYNINDKNPMKKNVAININSKRIFNG